MVVSPLVATLSRRDDDPMPTTGRTSRWTGTGSCLSRHGNEPGRPRRLGFHGTLSTRSWPGSGSGSSPNEGDFAGTASGPDLTAEGCGEPHPGRRTVAPGWTASFGTASRARIRWLLTCGFRCPRPACHLLPSTGICCSEAARTPGTPASSPPSAHYRCTAPDPRGRAQRPADVGGQAFARLGVKQTAHYLIRPDGHVGYRAAGTDLDDLQRHLAHWLPHTHTAFSLSNAAHDSHHRQHTYH